MPTRLAKHAVDRIDVLHIDAEGYDWMVLRQFDLRRYRPSVVRSEQSSLGTSDRAAAPAFVRAEGLEVSDFYEELVGVRRNYRWASQAPRP